MRIERIDTELFCVHLPSLYYRDIFKPQRQAEVAFVIQRPDGTILLHTKGHYPKSVYRIPTGTVAPGEDITKALYREVREETGLEVEFVHQLCRIQYRLTGGRNDLITYTFLLRHAGGEIRVHDASENITAWKSVPPSELRKVADELAGLEGDWAGWGLFRSVVHRIVADLLC